MKDTKTMDEKAYNPQKPVTVTLTLEQWRTVMHCLQYCADYHDAKKWEWLAACKDKQIAGQMVAQHEKQSMETSEIHKIIEKTVYKAMETDSITMDKSENVCAFGP